MLCPRCHRNVHDRGWSVIRGPDGRFALRAPDIPTRVRAP
jgi:hypothetical protein